MKKLLLLLLCVPLIGLGQDRYHADETNRSELPKILVLKSNHKAITGMVYDEHENGKLFFQTHYVDGKREGLSKGWDMNGYLSFENNYKSGKKDGLSTWYHKNGTIWRTQEYKDGKEDGLYKMWNENGKLIEEKIIRMVK